jgi:hypothetical protein
MAAETSEEARAAFVMRDRGLKLPKASVDEMTAEERSAWAVKVLGDR